VSTIGVRCACCVLSSLSLSCLLYSGPILRRDLRRNALSCLVSFFSSLFVTFPHPAVILITLSKRADHIILLHLHRNGPFATIFKCERVDSAAACAAVAAITPSAFARYVDIHFYRRDVFLSRPFRHCVTPHNILHHMPTSFHSPHVPHPHVLTSFSTSYLVHISALRRHLVKPPSFHSASSTLLHHLKDSSVRFLLTSASSHEEFLSTIGLDEDALQALVLLDKGTLVDEKVIEALMLRSGFTSHIPHAYIHTFIVLIFFIVICICLHNHLQTPSKNTHVCLVSVLSVALHSLLCSISLCSLCPVFLRLCMLV
jgi:hypothetical protein